MKKIALVTGGTRGIGKAIVELFSQNGYQVFFTYQKNTELAKELEKETGAISLQADSTKVSDVEEVIKTIQKYGVVEVLINNSGVSNFGLLTDYTLETFHSLLSSNLDGVFNFSRAILGQMIHEKHGKIINISSIWGQTGASCEVPYSTSKAAIIGFTKALAKEVAPSGILVNCIAPGVVDTEMNNHLSQEEKEALKEEIPLGRMADPMEIAKVALFLASDESAYITGQVISPNGGMYI